jgi:hypothetical protein
LGRVPSTFRARQHVNFTPYMPPETSKVQQYIKVHYCRFLAWVIGSMALMQAVY